MLLESPLMSGDFLFDIWIWTSGATASILLLDEYGADGITCTIQNLLVSPLAPLTRHDVEIGR